jgi:hypothetical protein
LLKRLKAEVKRESTIGDRLRRYQPTAWPFLTVRETARDRSFLYFLTNSVDSFYTSAKAT